MIALTVPAGPDSPQIIAPFVEGDMVRYTGTTYRTFTVARCYLQAFAASSRWIVEERNADTHEAAELELVRPSN